MVNLFSNKKIIYTLIIALILFVSSAISVIHVRRPKDLRVQFENNKITTSYATFGFNPYGYTLSGNLYYAGNNKTADLACNLEELAIAIQIKKDNNNNNKNDYSHLPIVMVDRGSCHFVDKVRNIQLIGGKAAIIVNNSDDDIEYIIMGDDGSASDITIPAVMISKSDGKILEDFYIKKAALEKDVASKISIDIDFQVEHKDNKARLDIFMSSSTEEVYKVFIEMYKYGFIKDICKFK